MVIVASLVIHGAYLNLLKVIYTICQQTIDLNAMKRKEIVLLQGRFSFSRKTITRVSLLKHARLDKSYITLMQVDQLSNSFGESEENLEKEQATNE